MVLHDKAYNYVEIKREIGWTWRKLMLRNFWRDLKRLKHYRTKLVKTGKDAQHQLMIGELKDKFYVVAENYLIIHKKKWRNVM